MSALKIDDEDICPQEQFSGLIEITKAASEAEAEQVLSLALNILKTMEKYWCNWEENEDSILHMGSESYRKGIHKPIIYGDYFLWKL